MARRRDMEIRDFPFDPEVRKVVFEEVSDFLGKLGDR